MSINLERLTASEAERLAYAEGYEGTARLFARIDSLQRALGQAVAALESIAYDLPERHRPGAALETLAIIENLEPGSVKP